MTKNQPAHDCLDTWEDNARNLVRELNSTKDVITRFFGLWNFCDSGLRKLENHRGYFLAMREERNKDKIQLMNDILNQIGDMPLMKLLSVDKLIDELIKTRPK